MQIDFPAKYEIITYLPSHQLASIHVPREYLQDVVNELQAQAWVSSVHPGIDGVLLNVYWSAAYEYPDGEPLAALRKICESVIEPDPVLDSVWSDALTDKLVGED